MGTEHGLSYLEVLRYYMAKDEKQEGLADFSFVFHHVDIKETKSVKMSKISMGTEGFPLIEVNPDFIQKGTVDFGVEVLKHNLWHLLCGHTELRVQNLIDQYGSQMVDAAADLVVNHYASEMAYKDAEVELVTAKTLGLEENQTLEYYIHKLKDIPSSQWPQPVGAFNADATDVDTAEFIDMTGVREKLAGKMPGEAEEYIKQLFTPPQVEWDFYLKQKEGMHRGRVAKLDKRRPSRRHDLHFGRRYRSSLRVAFVIDTSASMSSETLTQVEPEVRGISERGAEIKIMHADYDVQKVFDYRSGMPLAEYFGRGGTSFCPAFDELKKMEMTMNWKPDFVVYLTDGYGSAPEHETYDTLWVLVDDGMSVSEFRDNVCKWGQACKLAKNDMY